MRKRMKFFPKRWGKRIKYTSPDAEDGGNEADLGDMEGESDSETDYDLQPAMQALLMERYERRRDFDVR